MFRIRFHGRGGQGLKVASRILGSAFFGSGYQVQDAPPYGAERRGAPVFAYVRAARHAIHERGIIADPDLVAVSDDTLLPLPAAGVLCGVRQATVLLVYSGRTGDAWRSPLHFNGRIVVLSDTIVPEDHAAAACAGAAARLTGIVRRDALSQAVEREVGAFGAAAVQRTLEHVLCAYDACPSGAAHESKAPDARHHAPPQWVYLHAEPAQLAAPGILACANSALLRTGDWRIMRPVIDLARCNRCAWICSTYCPDSAIVVAADHTPRIDYAHCKGCLVCTTVCPPHAIAAQPEAAGAAS